MKKNTNDRFSKARLLDGDTVLSVLAFVATGLGIWGQVCGDFPLFDQESCSHKRILSSKEIVRLDGRLV